MTGTVLRHNTEQKHVLYVLFAGKGESLTRSPEEQLSDFNNGGCLQVGQSTSWISLSKKETLCLYRHSLDHLPCFAHSFK